MTKGPGAFKTIFTFWWFVDLVVYGVVMAGLTLATFLIPVYATHLSGGRGNLGAQCNEGFSEPCTNVYRGRASAYAVRPRSFFFCASKSPRSVDWLTLVHLRASDTDDHAHATRVQL
jgi:hypothetical protein